MSKKNLLFWSFVNSDILGTFFFFFFWKTRNENVRIKCKFKCKYLILNGILQISDTVAVQVLNHKIADNLSNYILHG